MTSSVPDTGVPVAEGRLPSVAHTCDWSSYRSTPERSLGIFEMARAECPVAHSREHDGFYMLLNYEDVRASMLSHEVFSSEPQVLRPMLPRQPIPALEMDPPRHGLWRALFSAAITGPALAALEPLIRADVDRHIDQAVERGCCDLVHELAEPVPAETICRLVGLDDELVPDVREAAIRMFADQGDPAAFAESQARFAALTIPEVHKRRRQPCDDYLTQLSRVEVEGRKLTDDDYVVLFAAFLGAGHHSTTSAMTSLFLEVLADPNVRDRLKASPKSIRLAIEEVLRLHPPFFGFFRRTKEPASVSGVAVPARSDVYLCWAAANRDPAVFSEPAVFSLDRPSRPHVSFGVGIHTCPGAALARMELRIALERLLARLPNFHLAPEIGEYRFGGGDYAFIPSLPASW